MTRLLALLLAGGSGTRFWPASRDRTPKQFLPIGGDEPLLAATSRRVTEVIGPERQLVITGARYLERVRSMLPDVPPQQVVGEPKGRDTAPAIGLGAHLARKLDENAIVVAMPSDHVIADEAAFRDHLRAAEGVLSQHGDAVLVFGIQPDRAATGYGYLKKGREIGAGLFELAAFVEKPDAGKAQAFLAEGNSFWNAGLFAFRPQTMMALFDEHLKGANEVLSRIAAAWQRDEFESVLTAEYSKLPRISIDYGVMEKAGNVLLIPMDIGWDDVGSWEALARLKKADGDGNVTDGDGVAVGSKNCILASEGGVVAVSGVDGLIVVHTPDATLVCRRDDAEGVKKVVAELKKRGLERFL